MFSRRGFIRTGAATVGSLALRPFGVLPALAQSSSNYKALVCVFLFGGNDANNLIVPMDGPTFNAYTSARAGLALTSANLTSTVYSTTGAPYAFHKSFADLANLFSSKELAVIANVGSLVQPVTRAQYQAAQTPVPMNLFSHADQQNQWQSSIAQGGSTTGWAGRVADYVESQNINTSKFPTFFSVAGNSLMGTGVNAEPVAISPGGSLTLAGFNTTAPSQARWNAQRTCSSLRADSRSRSPRIRYSRTALATPPLSQARSPKARNSRPLFPIPRSACNSSRSRRSFRSRATSA